MRKSVLVVDDNEINRLVISNLLNEFGLDCTIAASGEEAVKLVKYIEDKNSDRVDFIITDCIMAGIDGIETTRQIRQFSSIPVYGMSGNVTDQLIGAFKAAGAVDVLAKPLTPNALYKIICECLKEGDYLVPKDLLEIRDNVSGEKSLLKECLKGVHGIDYEKGLKTALGREDTFLKLLKTSVLNIRDYTEILGDYVHTADSNKLKLAAHSLKNIFANIGIDSLKYDSEVVENAADKLAASPENEVPSIMFHEHVHKYMMNVLSAASGIERAVGEYESINSSDVDLNNYIEAEEPLDARDKAEVISYTLDAMSKFEFDYIIEGLEKLRRAATGDERIKLEKALDAVNNYDYDKAKNIVTEISST